MPTKDPKHNTIIRTLREYSAQLQEIGNGLRALSEMTKTSPNIEMETIAGMISIISTQTSEQADQLAHAEELLRELGTHA